MIGARRRAQVLFLLALVVAGTRATPRAWAEVVPRGRIVLFAPPDDPLAGRLAAEIEAQGLAVERVAVPPPEAIEAIIHQTLAAGARVAVVVDGERRRTEVWSASPGSDRVALKQALEVQATADPDAALPVLALRTVELLRVDFGLGAPATPPAPAPPSPAPSTPVTVAVASGVLASTGRIAPLPIAGVSLDARLTPLLGAELWGYAPLGSDTLTDTAGSARTSVWLAGAGLRLALPTGERVDVALGAGPMLALVRAIGTAPRPGAGTTDQQLGVALYARAAARIRAGERWTFGLSVLGGGAVRRPVVTFVDHDITTWGAAFVAALATAGYTF